MTAYVTSDEYVEAMHLTEVPDNFDALADRASELMDDVTHDHYQYTSIEDDDWPLRVKRFKRAVMRQIAYMYDSGITTTEQAKRQPIGGSETIGRTTVSKTYANSNSTTGSQSVISDDALAALSGTGLLYGGIDHV